jgi:thiol:disulfide interchange protein DsbD
MGFLETAAAIKFISNADIVLQWGLFTREFFLASWIAIAVLITIYLLGKFHLPHDSFLERVGPVRVVLSMFFLACGFWLLTGLFGGRLGELDAFIPPQEYPGRGNTSPLANIPGGGGGGGSAAPEETWHQDDYQKALALAKKEGKPIFIDFTGYTCTNCRWMEKNMFPREDVASLMKKYVLLKLYLDGPEEVNRANQEMQMKRFKTVAMPFYAVINAEDSVVTTFPGMTRKSEKFVQFLEKGLVGHGDMAAR